MQSEGCSNRVAVRGFQSEGSNQMVAVIAFKSEGGSQMFAVTSIDRGYRVRVENDNV